MKKRKYLTLFIMHSIIYRAYCYLDHQALEKQWLANVLPANQNQPFLQSVHLPWPPNGLEKVCTYLFSYHYICIETCPLEYTLLRRSKDLFTNGRNTSPYFIFFENLFGGGLHQEPRAPGGVGGGRHIVVTRFFFRNAKICQNNHQKNYIFHPKLLEKVKIISNQLLIFQNDSSIQLALISYLKGMQDCSLLSIVLFKIYINQTLLKKGTLKMKKSHFPVTVLKYPSYSMVFL